ncbi:MAG TPA: TetR/AcrR family transcriptional regulator [Acidimicrobiia bacterium]|nr:TetR/AcrR family transcriptional regulator [Acidimicrobiia bacterium]
MTLPEPTTRERILQTAAAQFRRRGFKGTSMQDLAREVGLTKSGLYHHFPSKEALLAEILETTVNRTYPAVEEVATSAAPAGERLRTVVYLHVIALIHDQDNQACFIEEGRHLTRDAMEAYVKKRDRYEQFFRRILEDGIEGGEFIEHDVRLVAMALLGMCNWIVRWYRPDGGRSPEEIAAVFSNLAIRALVDGHMPKLEAKEENLVRRP